MPVSRKLSQVKAEGEQLDALSAVPRTAQAGAIRQNLEVLGYGE